MRLRHRSSGGGAKVAHGHFAVLLEEVFEVCRILVAASRCYGVHLVLRSGQQSLHLVQPPLGYGVEDAPPLEFAEPKVGEAARALEMLHHVPDADALQRVAIDVGDGFLHQSSGVRFFRRRFPLDNLLHSDEQRAFRRFPFLHHRVKSLCGKPTLLLEVRLYGRNAWTCVLADERVVVHP